VRAVTVGLKRRR